MLRRLVLFIAGFLFAQTAFARVQGPAWLAETAAAPATMSYGDASHVVLLDETSYDIAKNGVQTVRVRRAVRILTQEGKSAALASVGYENGSEKVKTFQAWHLPPTGNTELYGKKETLDTVPTDDAFELYQESREQRISARRDVVPGSVFGFESVIERKSVFTQKPVYFHKDVPVEKFSVVFHLPTGWSINAYPFNGDPVEKSVSGNAWTWTLRSIPAITDETYRPSPRDYLPWIALDLVVPNADKTTSGMLTFATWQDVSKFLSTRYDAPATADKTIRAKADELVAAAPGKSRWDTISSLSRFAQGVRYLSISIDLNKAGGATPRSSPKVLACGYGDCKDKATLLRSLLSTQGIESFPVVVYSGASNYVQPGWVSAQQFNHCIIAISVDDSVNSPAVITHPTLGRLLIFDPTHEDTPLGILPTEDMEGYGLIVAGDRGDLVKMPPFTSAANRYERTLHAQLLPDGSLRGTLQENSFGVASSYERSLSRQNSPTQYRTSVIEPWLRNTLTSAEVSSLRFNDDFVHASSNLDIAFASPAYGKRMQSTLMVFKPVIIGRREYASFKKEARKTPIVIRGQSFVERSEIILPEGYKIEESFPATELIAPFGRYRARTELKDRTLILERSLEVQPMTLPASDYDTARTFFEKMTQAEKAPVVLRLL